MSSAAHSGPSSRTHDEGDRLAKPTFTEVGRVTGSVSDQDRLALLYTKRSAFGNARRRDLAEADAVDRGRYPPRHDVRIDLTRDG